MFLTVYIYSKLWVGIIERVLTLINLLFAVCLTCVSFLPNMLDIPEQIPVFYQICYIFQNRCQLSTKYVRYSRRDVSFLPNMLDIPEEMSAFYQIC
jgi:hypothetical protein